MPGIHTLLFDRFRRRPEAPVLSGNARSARESWNGRDIETAVRHFAAGLATLGVGRGTKVGLVADNHDLWLVADLAVLSLGAVDVPRAADASPEEIGFVLDHSESTIAIVEDGALAKRLAATLAAAKGVRATVVLKGEAPPGALSFAEVSERGRAALDTRAVDLEKTEAEISPADLATIVYTSGTTGNPKGVMLTHANVMHNIRVLPDLVSITEEDSYLSFLPSWHTFERTFAYCVIAAGARLSYSSKATLRKDLLRVRPTLVAGVPRLWESIASGVLAKVAKLAPVSAAVASFALKTSERLTALRYRTSGRLLTESFAIDHGTPLTAAQRLFAEVLLGPCHGLADRLVYSKIRDALGGKIRFIVSGGGALPLHVDELLNRAGITLLNGYGLTETAPVVSVRLPGRNILATAGRPLAETSFRVMAEDGVTDLGRRKKGVLWIRGPQVMKGYFKNPDATAKVLRDGWFNSGDLAVLTDDDDVIICGRVKDTLVLRGGENVEPENIETELVRSPLIADAVVVGHTQKHLAALIVPNAETILGPAPAEGYGDTSALTSKETEARIHAEVQRLISAERGYRVFERVPKISLIAEPFTVEGGTLTPTLKKRRHVIESLYADRIRALFSESDGNDV